MRFVSILSLVICFLALESQGFAQKMRIATEGAYPPFNFVDQAGQLQGFDIEIAKAVCEKMKVECEIVAQDWDGILPGLLAKKYDAIFAAMSITPERLKKVSFSDPYYRVQPHFVIRKEGGLNDLSPSGLQGKVLGVQSGTVHAHYLEKMYPQSTLKLYPTFDDVFADLASGRLDAVLADKIVLSDWLEHKGGKECCLLANETIPAQGGIFGAGIGAAMRLEAVDLKERVNRALKEMQDDGTYAKIKARFFLAP